MNRKYSNVANDFWFPYKNWIHASYAALESVDTYVVVDLDPYNRIGEISFELSLTLFSWPEPAKLALVIYFCTCFAYFLASLIYFSIDIAHKTLHFPLLVFSIWTPSMIFYDFQQKFAINSFFFYIINEVFRFLIVFSILKITLQL